MLRHSISQVFGLKHPALSPRESDDITGRQPRSSYVKSQFPAQRQHQVSDSDFLNKSYLNLTLQPSNIQGPIPMPAPVMQPLSLPGHMPPAVAAPVPYSPAPAMLSQAVRRDASNLHPVFFTERLRRSPLMLDAAGMTSPVAHGYVYHTAQGKAML
ncbi:hypothetical protein GGS26DRAFT_547520 [Hypomontagnella submonticulosa]|nr:hypothetical protein GGS26DRAFT_547520 [Hypomontagnella submonticulosa]